MRVSARTGSGVTIIKLPTDKERCHLFEVWVGPPGHTPPSFKQDPGV